MFAVNHDGCKSNGIPLGAYFLFVYAQDGVSQAEHFLHVADGRYGELFPVIDIEEKSAAQGLGISVEQRIDNLKACVDRLARDLAEPIIYTNADTWKTYFEGSDAFSTLKLWVADPHHPAGAPTCPRGWSTWAVHQYADGLSKIPGIVGHDLDLDCLNGDYLALILST